MSAEDGVEHSPSGKNIGAKKVNREGIDEWDQLIQLIFMRAGAPILSDESEPFPVKIIGIDQGIWTTPTIETIVSVTDTSGLIIAADPLRKGGWLKNISDFYMWLRMTSPARTDKPTRLAPGEKFYLRECGVPITGAVYGIHAQTGLSLDLEVVGF